MAQDVTEKKFNVRVKRIAGGQAEIDAHGQKIILSTRGADPRLGITAPEAVLAALGTCVISNVNKLADEMKLVIDDVVIAFEARKRLAPLGIKDLRCTVAIKSSEPAEKLQVLYKKALSNGTATNALLEGLKPEGRLAINGIEDAA